MTALGLLLARPRLRLALLAAALAAAFIVTVGVLGVRDDDVRDAVDGSGALGPLLFVGLFAALVVVLVPGAVGCTAAGALFGPFAGTLLAVAGATLGAVLAFAAGRRLGRAAVLELSGPRAVELDAALCRRGFAAVVAVRLVPLIPFTLTNYVAGATSLRARDFAAGTMLGIVPTTFAIVSLGASFQRPGSAEFLGAAALLVGLAAAGPLVYRRRRRTTTTGHPREGAPSGAADRMAGRFRARLSRRPSRRLRR